MSNNQTVELEISGLTKTFNTNGLSVVALDNVDLQINQGEFVSIIGTSGCGKTTLLRIIAGLENEFIGNVELEGEQIVKPGIDKGVVFQDHPPPCHGSA